MPRFILSDSYSVTAMATDKYPMTGPIVVSSMKRDRKRTKPALLILVGNKDSLKDGELRGQSRKGWFKRGLGFRT